MTWLSVSSSVSLPSPLLLLEHCTYADTTTQTRAHEHMSTRAHEHMSKVVKRVPEKGQKSERTIQVYFSRHV